MILDFELGFNLQTYCLDVIHFDLPWKTLLVGTRNGRIDRKLQPAKQIVCRYVFYEQREADIMLEAPTQKTEFIRDRPKNGADRVKGLCLHARSRKSATQSGSLTRAPNWMTKSAGGMRGCCRSKTTCTVPSNDHESASALKMSGSSCATNGSLTGAKHGVPFFFQCLTPSTPKWDVSWRSCR